MQKEQLAGTNLKDTKMDKRKEGVPDGSCFLPKAGEHETGVQNTHKDEIRTLQSPALIPQEPVRQNAAHLIDCT